MRRFATFCNAALWVTAVWALQIPAALSAPSTQQSIDQLQSDDPADRDEAEVQLCGLGKAAIDSLMTATNDSRPEVRLRARRVLRRIQLFLLPNVPGRALSIAATYLDSTDPDARHTQLNLLFQIQPPPTSVLTRLVGLETDEDLRRQILYRLRVGYRDEIGRMLIDEKDPQQILGLLNGASAMWGQGEGEAADDAAANYFTGNFDQQIQLYKAQQANGDAQEKERAAVQLCFLYRISGDLKLALAAARASREQTLVFLVLTDQADWDTAASQTLDWQNRVMGTAFLATCNRLGGHRDQATKAANALVGLVTPDPDDSFIPSKYLLLNDQPQHGMDMLVDRHPAAVFSMLVARGQIDQAIALAGKYFNHPTEGTRIAELNDELHRTLGELPELPARAEKPANPSSLEKAWQTAVSDLAQKKYQPAADEFGAIWEIDHTHFDRLYLQGYSLKAAGNAERGAALMDIAEMVPLGDPLRRWQFAAQLDAAGLPDVAEQQRGLALRTGKDFDEVGFSEIYNTRAETAMDRKQWHAAADAIDRLCLINLSSQVQWQDPTRLLTIPALAHLLRSRELRERGDLAAALVELAAYQQYLPASSDMVLDWVPALDDLGQHQKADELFSSVYEKVSTICQKYPNSVTYHNQLAWMCACCGRKLDEAISAAEAATRLKPDSWQALDTLAEVHFRRGDRASALSMEKRAVGMSSDPYLVRQLKRFESMTVPSTTQPGPVPE